MSQVETPAAVTSPPPIPAAVWRLAVVIVFGAFMSTLDTSVVNVGLDRMAHSLDAPLSTAQWVASGYLLALAAVMPLTGWLTRRLGARPVWLAALASFTVISGGCALAGNMSELIVLRILQGIAGGMLVPAGQIILARAAGPARMGRVMSTVGIAVVLAPVIGPVLGGLLINLSWRWLFAINLPIGAVGLIAGLRRIPRQPPAGTSRLDLIGVVLSGAGLSLLTYGVTVASQRAGLDSAGAIGGLAGGTLALIVFAVRALRIPAPLLNLHLWRNQGFSAALAVGFFAGGTLFGVLVLMPLYFEIQRGQSTVATGLLLIGQGVGAAITMPLAGRLTDRFGGGIVSMAGLSVTAISIVPLALMGARTSLVAVEVVITLLGLGLGVSFMPAVAAAYSAISPDQLADATPQLNAVQRVGGSIGTAVTVVVVSRGLAAHHAPVTAFHAGLWFLFAATVLALLPATALMRVLRRRRPPVRRP
jgi:EmrB/QacA subfamily drug resistance transporter